MGDSQHALRRRISVHVAHRWADVDRGLIRKIAATRIAIVVELRHR